MNANTAGKSSLNSKGWVKAATSTLALLAMALSGLRADSYWVANDGDFHNWADAANWAASADGQTAATGYPDSDTEGIYSLTDGTAVKMFANLNGASYTVKEWLFTGTTHAAKFKNGTITFAAGGQSDASGSTPVDVGADATLIFNGKFGSGILGGASNSGWSEWTLHDGGTVIVNDEFYPRWLKLQINSGGRFVYGSTAKGCDCNNNQDFPVTVDGGTLEFTSGFNKYNSAWSFRPLIKLNSGSWIIGGDLKYTNNIYFRVELAGGTVRATNDVSFRLRPNADYTAAYAKIMPNADLTLEVAENRTMDMAASDDTHVPFAYELDTNGENHAKITRTGAGTLLLADVPYSLDLESGTTAFSANTRTAMGSLKLATGQSFNFVNANTTLETLEENAGTITISARGLKVNSVSATATLPGTIAVNGANLFPGDVVIDTPSDALRAKVAAALETADVAYVTSSNALVVAGEVLEKIFTGAVSTDLSNPDNWECGYVPTDNAVGISGTADFTAASPTFEKITVTSTGTLNVANGATLPNVTLQGTATMTIAAGATVTMTAADMKGEPVDGVQPTLVIGAGATLAADATEDFANITIVNNGGTIDRTSATPLVYKWVGANPGDFTNLENWTDVNDNVVTRLPCRSDSFYNSGSFYLDMAGGDWEIGGWATPGDWDNHYLSVSNGSLTFRGNVSTHSGTWTISNNGTVSFAQGTTFTPAQSCGSVYLKVDVSNGGVFDFNGALSIYSGKFIANSGGRIIFNHTSIGGSSGTTQPYSEITANTGGYIAFPNGLDWARGGWDSRFACPLNLNGGELLLGGDVTKANITAGGLVFNVNVTGGKLDITDDVTITADSSTLSGNVEIDVAQDVKFSLANFDVDSTAAIVKSGKGVLVLDSTVMPASLALDAGYIGFYTPNTAIALPASTTVTNGKFLIGANGLTVDPATVPEGVTFEVDVAAITKDAAIIASADAALLERIKTDFETQLAGQPYEVSIQGGEVVISAISLYTFTGVKSTDYADPDNWACGYVPAGQAVTICGDMVVSGEFPQFASISIERGAAVTVADGITLPAVNLSLNSSLTIAENAAVSIGNITGSATASLIPVLKVSEGATLTVPAGHKFGNINLKLQEGSTLAEDGDGSLVFGYAAAGETAYFAMSATNATIEVKNLQAPEESGASAYNGAARIDFASPAATGRVVAGEPISLKGVNFKRVYVTENHYIYDGFAFGLNNPENEPVKIIIDDSFVIFGEHSWISGGVNLVLTNNAVLCRSIFPNAATQTGSGRNEGDKTDNWFNLHITGAGKLTLVDGGELRAGVGQVNKDVIAGIISMEPSVAGYAGIEVLDGGIAAWYKMNGSKHKTVYNNKWADPVTHANAGSVVFNGGTMDVFKDFWWGYGNRAHIFNGLATVNVAENSTLTLRGVPDKLTTEWAHLESGVELESPFSGAGNVTIVNTWQGKTLAPALVRGDNTCTGTISAVDAGNGANAILYVANGANWAGTVVANGNMALIDAKDFNDSTLSTHQSPVAVTFGALRLDANLPVYVWRGENNALQSDTLDVAMYINNGGRIIPTMATDGAAFANGDSFTLGKIGKTSPTPAIGGGWMARRIAIDGDDAYDRLLLVKSSGMQLIFR